MIHTLGHGFWIVSETYFIMSFVVLGRVIVDMDKVVLVQRVEQGDEDEGENAVIRVVFGEMVHKGTNWIDVVYSLADADEMEMDWQGLLRAFNTRAVVTDNRHKRKTIG